MPLLKPQTRLVPLADWGAHHTWPTASAMRQYVFRESENGFRDHNVVKRVGRRVLIDEAAFFRWVDAQPGNGGDAKG